MGTVTSRAELLSALDKATGGETIVLADGYYGSLDIDNKSYSDTVTIVSENPLGAKFETIGVSNSSNIRIDSVHVDNSSNGSPASAIVSIDSGSHDVEFVNSEVNGLVDGTYSGHYGIYTNNATSVTIANNYVHDIKNGGVFSSTKDLVVSGNTIDYIGEDSFKFISINGALIENNTGARFVYPSATAHCDFIQFQGGDSSDIVIRGNVSLPWNSAATGAQGIFMDDAHYTNILIEDNIIVTGMIRGVSVSSGTNVVARNNTVLDVEGYGSKATKVMVDGTSYDNVMGSYKFDKTLGDNGNVVLQQADPNYSWHYDDFYANADKGLGMTIEDLRPVEGSGAESAGAYNRIMELLNGDGSTTPGTAPDSTENTDSTDTTTDPGSTDTADKTTDTSEPADTATTGTIDDAAFSMTGTKDIASAADVIEIAPDASLNLASGTIALTFQADTVSGKMGLVTRDASFYAGGGNHFAAYIENGALKLRFQDGNQDKVFEIPGIQAGKAYDLLVDFDGTTVNVTLDGVTVGSAEFGMTWLDNNEYMQFGALGWGSATGKAGFGDVFDGKLSDIVVTEGVKTPAEIEALLVGDPDATDGTDTTGSTDEISGTDTTGDTDGMNGTDTTDDTGSTDGTGGTDTTDDSGSTDGTDTTTEPPATDGTITVSSGVELVAALKNASGGEIIVLQDGDYGTVSLSGINLSTNVTVQAENALGASFSGLDISGSSNITFDGIHVEPAVEGARFMAYVDIGNSKDITIVNSEINGPDGAHDGAYGLRVDGNSTDITIKDNFIHDIRDGAVFFSVSDLVVSGNRFEDVGHDSLKFGGVTNTVIEGNIGATNYTHPDFAVHNDFIQFQASSSGVEIRGNVFLLNSTAKNDQKVVQGIFIKDGAYSDFVIEENVVHTNTVNGIYIESVAGTGSNFTIANNTVLSTTDITKWGDAQIRIVSLEGDYRIENNIVDSIDDQVKNGTVTGNLIVQWEDAGAPNHYSDVYASVGASGAKIQNFAPVPGGPADGSGALGASEWIDIHLGDSMVDTGTTDGDGDTGTGTTTDRTDGTDTTGDSGTTDETSTPPTTEEGGNSGENGTIYSVIFSMTGTKDIASAADVIEIAPDASLNLATGTIAFTFEADIVSGKMGLVTRDASYYAGGGNHFATYIEEGTLKLRFQDGSEDKVFEIPGIQAGKAYDLLVDFDGTTINVTLDDVNVGSAEFGMTWLDNNEYMQFGALGWGSATGEAGFGNVFDGKLSDIVVTEGVKTPAEIDALLAGPTDATDGTDTTGSTDDTGGTDTPAPDAPASAVLTLADAYEFDESSDVFEFQHSSQFGLPEATIALTFNADKVSGMQGLLSKDASGFGGGGNHFTSYIDNGTLFVRFQDGQNSKVFSVDGIKANVDYDLQASFGDGRVVAMLDGQIFGEAAFDTSWEDNVEFLQIGANGWASKSGESGFRDVFDGTISDVTITSGIVLPHEFDMYI